MQDIRPGWNGPRYRISCCVREASESLQGRHAGFPTEKVYVNIDRTGNTSAASIPIALDEARRRGKIKSGDTILMVAFGAGLTWGSAVVKM